MNEATSSPSSHRECKGKMLLLALYYTRSDLLQCAFSKYFSYSLLQLDRELERRKEVGFRFQQTLQLQNNIFVSDEDDRENHQVGFMAIAREVARLLKEYADVRKNNTSTNNNSNSNEEQDNNGEEFDENLMLRCVFP